MRCKTMEIIIETMNLNGGNKDKLFLSSWGVNDRIVFRTETNGFVVSKAELKKAMALLELDSLLSLKESECID